MAGGWTSGLPACIGAVRAELAAGYYTPKRVVGTRVSGFVVRQLFVDCLDYLVKQPL